MFPAALLFLSGAAALVYQTLWVKQLGLVVGVDVYGVTIAVGAFFAGLACGGPVFGARADRSSRPFALCAALELGIALLGVGTTLLLSRAAPIFVDLHASVGPAAWAYPFLLIGLPAFLMGGTLPVLVRARRPGAGATAQASGNLYAANTVGAIAGTLATPFLLLPALGVRGTALAAAACNLLVAVLAAARGGAARLREASPPKAEPLAAEARTALALYAVAGGVALGYEVVWTQAIVQLIGTRAYAFAIVLATYLTGLALGSALYARVADRVRQPWTFFGLLIAGAGASALLIFAGLGGWLPNTQDLVGKAAFSAVGSDMIANSARFALAAGVVVLLPTMLLGAAFPAAMRLVAGPGHIGRDVGAVTALNTAGGILGTLVTGFLLVPAVGLVRGLGILAAAASVLGAVAVLRGEALRGRSAIFAVALLLITVVTAAVIQRDKLAHLLLTLRPGRLVRYEESPGGMVAVIEQKAAYGSFRRLYIQGTSNSGDALTSLRYMRLQALLPLLIHRGEPRSALVIGLGTGITAGALLAYPGLERRVCVELLPAVVRAAPLFMGNFGVASDPRVEIRIRDGRHELLHHTERYDLITLEPPPPPAMGVVNLYSRDFYELGRARLQAHGLFAQWWPLPTQNDEDSRSLVRSFIDVFPHVTLWTTELHEMLLIGSNEPIELNASRITKRFAQPEVAAVLGEVGVASPAALLATYVTDRAGLERYVAGAPAVTDDRPRIEYAGWVRDGEFERVLRRVLALASAPPLLGGDAELRAELEDERRRLFDFYGATLAALAGEHEQWRILLSGVLSEDPHNPYYLWFVGRP